MTDTLGYRIRQRRKELGISARDLATKLSLSESAVRNVENGTNGATLKRAELYAAALGVSSEWLLFGGEDSIVAQVRPPRIPEGASLTQMTDTTARLTLNKVLPFSVALQILTLVQGDEK